MEDHLEKVRDNILAQVRTVFDYEDTEHEVIEDVVRTGSGSYSRFKKGMVSR